MHMNSLHITLRVLIFLYCASQIAGADAARITDLYAAQVPVEAGVTRNLAESFDQALREVLVKVTGRRGITDDLVVMEQFAVAERYVQQHRTNPDGSLWVRFDQVAIRRTLDGIGQPVWGEERPTTLVWLVMDNGKGGRDILAAESDFERERDLFEVPSPGGGPEQQAAVSEIMQTTADERGLPLVLPLVDSEELDIVSISDVWGGFTESVVLASQRYGVDAILVGRARVLTVERARVRWTLMLGDEKYDWEGDIARGPDRSADFFAARFATSSSALGQMQLRVDGVDSFDDYGRLSRYLSSLDVIEDYSVERIADQTVIFSLQVRGDTNRLTRSIALRGVLQPMAGSPGAMIPDVPPSDPFGDEASSLHYALITVP
jgi:hypothetical protein